MKLLIEIKGYAPHVRYMDRQKYCNELNRETFLIGMGYQVISFAYDDVEQRPDVCIALLPLVLSRYQPALGPVSRAVLAEKEVVRLAVGQAGSVRPKDVALHFEVDIKTAILLLQKMRSKGWLLPLTTGKGERIIRYQLARGMLDYLD